LDIYPPGLKGVTLARQDVAKNISATKFYHQEESFDGINKINRIQDFCQRFHDFRENSRKLVVEKDMKPSW
jgi:hypothetical protein